MKLISLPGINIQYPWSELLLTGKKTIETRTYKIPDRLINKPIAIIETPGKSKKFKARITGIIIFSYSKEYLNAESWQSEYADHLVDPNDKIYGFRIGRKKFGWVVGKYYRLQVPIEPPVLRGIVYAQSCLVPEFALNQLL